MGKYRGVVTEAHRPVEGLPYSSFRITVPSGELGLGEAILRLLLEGVSGVSAPSEICLWEIECRQEGQLRRWLFFSWGSYRAVECEAVMSVQVPAATPFAEVWERMRDRLGIGSGLLGRPFWLFWLPESPSVSESNLVEELLLGIDIPMGEPYRFDELQRARELLNATAAVEVSMTSANGHRQIDTGVVAPPDRLDRISQSFAAQVESQRAPAVQWQDRSVDKPRHGPS